MFWPLSLRPKEPYYQSKQAKQEWTLEHPEIFLYHRKNPRTNCFSSNSQDGKPSRRLCKARPKTKISTQRYQLQLHTQKETGPAPPHKSDLHPTVPFLRLHSQDFAFAFLTGQL